MNTEHFIREIKKIVAVQADDFETITASLRSITLKKNEVWEKEGRVSQYMGFLNAGVIRQYYLKDGNEFTDNFFIEGQFLGNYISFLSNEPSKVETAALEPCELLVMPFEDIEKHKKTFPAMAKFSQSIGDQKLFELNQRSASLLMDTPEERYFKFLKEKPELFSRVPQYHIAQYLGIRPESLSRIRKRHLS